MLSEWIRRAGDKIGGEVADAISEEMWNTSYASWQGWKRRFGISSQ